MSQNSHMGPLFRDLKKILTSSDKIALQNCILIANISEDYNHQCSAAGTNFRLNLTVIIQDGQILVTLKFLSTKLKPVADIQ